MAEMKQRTDIITSLECGKFSASVRHSWLDGPAPDLVRTTTLNADRSGVLQLNDAEIDNLIALLQAAKAVKTPRLT